MGQEYLGVIIQVSIFMICARMILHLRIKASGEKYIKGIVGLMVIAFMVTSMASKWKDIQRNEIFPNIEEMEKRMEEMMKTEMKEMERNKIRRNGIDRNEIDTNGFDMGNKSDNYVDLIKEKMIMDVMENMQEEGNEIDSGKESKEKLSIRVEQTTVVIGKDRE